MRGDEYEYGFRELQGVLIRKQILRSGKIFHKRDAVFDEFVFFLAQSAQHQRFVKVNDYVGRELGFADL